MTLEKYIKELLYRYDCVIVPDFGGFVTNNKPARIVGSTFLPPYKQITFNTLLQNNDGLLANHIASVDKMPYETAVNFINFEVEVWIEKLMEEELVLSGIGALVMENDTIQFEPETQTNYLTSSFGLSSYISDTVLRVEDIVEQQEKELQLANQRAIYKEQVEEIEAKAKVFLLPNKSNRVSNIVKYAAIFVLSTSIVGLLGTKMYQDNLEKKQILALQKEQKTREIQIQEATFVIESPLPTITLKTVAPVDKYFIIAGAFRNKANAKKKVRQLAKKGFEAKIIGTNKWNLTQVAFSSYVTLDEASKNLNIIKKNIAKDAWLLVK